MFQKRTVFATNEELLNQRIVNDVLLLGQTPQTIIEKKAAAICGNTDINAVQQAKVFNNLNAILDIVESAAANVNTIVDENGQTQQVNYMDMGDLDNFINVLQMQYVRSNIIDYVQSVPKLVPNEQTNDYHRIQVTINRKPPVLTLMPNQIFHTYDDELDAIQSNFVTPSKLWEFEQLCFNNRTQFRYMSSTDFARYMYQNLIYYLALDETALAETIKPCANNESEENPSTWQKRLLVLIVRVEFNSLLVEQAFYEDTIVYRGVEYDCSFVPKYDVRSIQPQKPINYKNLNDLELIRYHENLNIRTINRVPDNKIAIFLALPFKDGHLIKPCGKIVYLNLETFTNRRSARILIQDLCNIHDLENAVESAARLVPLDYVVWHAVNAKTIKEQAVSLLVLRRLVGDSLSIDGNYVELADELTILSWTELSCSYRNVAIPPVYPNIPSSLVDTTVQMIQTIAASCFSKTGAAFLCSRYGIPEMIMGNVYEKLKTPSEKYVFFTLMLQEYPIQMYNELRNQLNNVEFGSNIVDLRDMYEPFHRQYVNSVISDRTQLYSEPLLRPDEVNSDVVLCNPIKCFEAYEYTDEQLNALIKNAPVTLNATQLANLIVLMVF